MKTLTKAFVCLLLLAGLVVRSQAALVTAGTLQAYMEPTNVLLGYIDSNGIVNTGAMGGVWQVEPTNNARLTNLPLNQGPSVIVDLNGKPAVVFDGSATNALVSYTAGFNTGTNNPAPLSLTGPNPSHSIEVWAMAPVLGEYSTMVMWGTINTASNQNTFGWGGSEGNVGGAVNHGSSALHWGAGGPPAPGVYHHLVETYDASTTNLSLYCDGVLMTNYSVTQGAGILTNQIIPTNYPINIGSTRDNSTNITTVLAMMNGRASTGEGSGTGHARMHIAKVRIMDGVLTAANVLNNFTTDQAAYQPMAPALLAHAPIHRYNFTNSAAGISGTATVADTGTAAGASATVYATPGNNMATFTGTALHLAGGPQTNGSYVDLPTNIISSMSTFATNNGVAPGSPGSNSTPGTGTGQVTLEGWLTVKGHPNFWQTYFAFGGTTATNIENYTFVTNFSGTNPISTNRSGTNRITTNIVAGHFIGLQMPLQSGPGGLPNGAAADGQLSAVNNGQGSINMWLFQQNNNDPSGTKMDLNGNVDSYYGGYSNGISTPNFDYNWYGYGQNQRYPFTMTYYAASWNEATGEILTYINGMETSRRVTTMKFFHLYDRNCWLGRDMFHANPTLEGDYSEFRIYSNILSPAEVLGDYQTGPHYLNTVALGALNNIHIVRTTSVSNWVGTVAYFTVTGDYAGGLNGVNVFANGPTYTTSDATVATVTPGQIRFLKAGGPVTITANYGGKSDSLVLTVKKQEATLTHRYSFSTADSIGAPFDSVTASYPSGAFGYVGSQILIPASGGNGAVRITNGVANGDPGWVDFGPNFISPTYDALTVEMWATFGSPGNTAPLFSFGDQRINPQGLVSNVNANGYGNGALPMRGRYFIEAWSRPNIELIWSADDPAPGQGTAYINNSRGTSTLDNQQNVHYVAVIAPTAGFAKTYINGVPSTGTNLYLPLVNALVDNYNYLGQSINNGYPANPPGVDPPFPPTTPINNGSGSYAGSPTFGSTNNMVVDEFRTYNGILQQSNVVLDLATGPDKIVTDPGSISNITLVTSNSVLVSQTLSLSLSATWTNGAGVVTASNVNMLLYDGLATLTSSSNALLTVSATASTMTGVATGAAYVTATYPGFPAVSNLVQVISITPVIQHRWSFETNTLPSVIGGVTNFTQSWDSIANVLNGTNWNGAYETNHQLQLSAATQDYMELPTGILNTTTNYLVLSIEFWISVTNAPATNAANTDVYGFGDINFTSGFGRFYVNFSGHSGTNSMAAHINPTDPPSGGNGEFTASPTGILDGRTNVHIVVVYHPLVGFLQVYTNGVLAVTNTITSNPLALQQVQDVYSFLGKPLYQANAYLNASIDEFRLYAGLMAQPQIMIDTAIGPNQILNLNNANSNLGILTALSMTVNPNMLFDQSQTATVTGTWTNSSALPGVNVNLSVSAFATATGASNINFWSGNSNVLTVNGTTITAVGIGDAGVYASWSNKVASAWITVGSPAGLVSTVHDFHFSESIGAPGPVDSITSLVGTNQGTGATFDGLGHLALANTNLSGPTTNYVDLPPPMLTNLSNATIEVWLTSTDAKFWSRIFDFGETDTVTTGNGLDYTYMTGNGNGEGVAFRSKPIGATFAFDPAGPNAGAAVSVDTNGTYDYIAVSYGQDSLVQALYVNGTNYARSAVVSPLSSVNEVSDFLGRSHYSGDPGANYIYDEFRISTNTKSQAEIVSQKLAGPNAIAGAGLSISNSPVAGLMRLTWPNWGPRYGVINVSTSLTAPNWTPLGGSPTIVSNAAGVSNFVINYIQDVAPVAGAYRFYRLQ